MSYIVIIPLNNCHSTIMSLSSFHFLRHFLSSRKFAISPSIKFVVIVPCSHCHFYRTIWSFKFCHHVIVVVSSCFVTVLSYPRTTILLLSYHLSIVIVPFYHRYLSMHLLMCFLVIVIKPWSVNETSCHWQSSMTSLYRAILPLL